MSKRTSKVHSKLMKITYISDPMMYKVNSTEFKTLVQQLTGKDSYASSSEVTNEMITVDDILNDGFSNAISSIKFPVDYSRGEFFEETIAGFSPHITLYDEICFREF